MTAPKAPVASSMLVPHPILYVDDEAPNRLVFEASFGDEFDIVLASSGAEALEKLAEQPFDVLLTDQRMPGMIGAELCEHVRDAYPDVQRIMLTAYAERESLLQAINQGRVSGFLTKPWRAEEVRRTLAEAQSLAHQTRLANEIAAAMSLKGQAELQGQVLHDLANVASRVTGCCEELEELYPELATALPSQLCGAVSDELRDLRSAVDFLHRLHAAVRGLHVQADRPPDEIVLHHIVQGSVSVARPKFPAGCRVDIDCDPELRVIFDRTDLGRILVNLAVNAGHAMNEASTKQPRLCVTAVPGDDTIVLQIRDNGPGIPEALHERIFEPRFTTRENTGGTGLGLAISRHLATDNDAELRLLADGPGAAFELTLPRAPHSAPVCA